MKPVFIDLHIHTSDNPSNPNQSYDLDVLKTKVEEVAKGSAYLISLTDHNAINKSIYLKAVEKFDNILLGVELHVRNYDTMSPYHCHIYFNLPQIDEASIDIINSILDELYPIKLPQMSATDIPKLTDIMNGFDAYEFLLLPHGGQNHSTFDMSIPNGVQFDNTLMRSVYYNHFDGFTARSNTSLEKTHEYFDRLGIIDFVNLITATDNYDPRVYPNGKAGSAASSFTPTWIMATPTFNGLRLSLSESSRLHYGEKPDSWAECIKHVSLKNDHTNIDVDLTPGLNVVIGGSSSGKSLFVDSLFRKIVGDFSSSIYLKTQYGVKDIEVANPAGQHPHYLDQNYISKICDPSNKEYNINDITILQGVFPSDREERAEISNGLSDLGSQLSKLVQSVREIEILQTSLERIPRLSHLIVTEVIQGNPLKSILPKETDIEIMQYSKADYDRHVKALDDIDRFLSSNPFISHDSSLVKRLNIELKQAREYAKTERLIRQIIFNYSREIDANQANENREIATKRQQFETLLADIRNYINHAIRFNESLEAISKFKIKITTREIESMGHKLSIDNEFKLTKETFLEVINEMLRKEERIARFDDIKPEALFKSKFRKRDPKVSDYDDFERLVNAKFNNMNKKKYRITTKEGKDFDNLSAGWKTSVILDLILGWGSDNAPLIIDQPEDNLATSYINHGLITAIKNCKSRKQIILVSHNATIPMLGDAQNVVMCSNQNNFITIKSNPLEGSIDGLDVVDLIAIYTDGGKGAVKKRVKKYNLKNYRGTHEASVQEE